MEKLTPWFPNREKPVRHGVYQVAVGCGNYYSYFDDKGWHGAWWSPEKAWEHAYFDASIGYRHWRGLASDPSKG